MTPHRTLILGESKSGKTHFVGQIFGRTRQGAGRLRLRTQPGSLKILEEVLDRLSEGRSASHTPAGFYGEITFDLASEDGNIVELVWPDYAGEQISEIVAKRALRPEWAERVDKADSWTLLVRLSGIVNRKTALFTAPQKEGEAAGTVVPRKSEQMPDQMRFVELLQILRHCRISRGKEVPPLTVLLTCADELAEIECPRTAIDSHLPMLTSFIDANWGEGKWSCWAVSALGRALHDRDPDLDFAAKGPAHEGYIIDPRGKRDPDLTLPFATAVGIT